MVRASLLVAVVLAGSPALAQPGHQGHQGHPGHQGHGPKAVPAVAVDTTGWTLLGEQEVKGKRDRDTIVVGKYEGKFDQIQLVVLDSDIQLKELVVHFSNGEKWAPALAHSFKEGQRSRAIDLPGNNRQIAKIDLNYANTPGGGRARVAVYGRDKKAPPPHTKPAVFDPKGWTLLGSQTVQGKRDRDTIIVGKQEGKFDKVAIQVLDSDIELKDLAFTFANGEKWSPALKHFFKEGQRSRTIDLPGNTRQIAKVELVYANIIGGGKARVEVYARDSKQVAPPQPPPFVWDSKGWTKLGERTVDGRRDKDRIDVGMYSGQFDQLTMVVTESDLELKDMTINFSNRMSWSPKLAHFFKEGSRTRVIDLPGKDRKIVNIKLAYANTPGGGKAKVAIYGRDQGRPTPPPYVPVNWDNKGWTLIGKSTVDGWRDRDKLAVRAGKPFSELTFVVTGSDVELRNVLVTFGNGEKFEMPSAVVFKEGTRTAPIDIPGKIRMIKSIEFAYANLPGGGRASLEVWARAKSAPPPLPPPGGAPATPPTQQPPAPTPPPATTPPPPPVRDHRK